MRAKRSNSFLRALLFAAPILAGCNAVLGLNQLSISDDLDPDATTPPIDVRPDNYVGECTTNSECTDRVTAAAIASGRIFPDGGGDAGTGVFRGAIPAVCVHPESRCVELLNEHCTEVVGDFRNDNAVILGTMFSLTGSQALTNLPRQRSATLAAEQINAVGGIPSAAGSVASRPLVVVSCNELPDPTLAGGHLVNELHVPAIVGPNTSQDTIDLSNKLTIQAGTVLMTPTAVASSIPQLMDNDLTWLMVPSDTQRGRLMIDQINQLELDLADRKTGSKMYLRLGIVFRDDALGQGTRQSLNALNFNGKALTDVVNAGSTSGNVTIDGYVATAPDQAALVSKYVTFLPDVIVLAGTAETVTQVMNPIEAAWPMAAPRPHYVVIDSAKVPELLTAATSNMTLRTRVRGTGVTASPDSVPVKNAFELDYRSKWGEVPTASGVGPSFDAMYSIAYALAATRDEPVTGAAVAKGLRKLAGGETLITTGSGTVLTAFDKLGMGQNITGTGTFLPLDWDARGAVIGGTIEVWCVGAPTGTPVYMGSGLTYDVKSDKLVGAYKQCGDP